MKEARRRDAEALLVAMMHYPGRASSSTRVLRHSGALRRERLRSHGHLHGAGLYSAIRGERDGIRHQVSCDGLISKCINFRSGRTAAQNATASCISCDGQARCDWRRKMEKQLLLILTLRGPAPGQRMSPEIIRTFWDFGHRCVTYVTAQSGDPTRYLAEHAGNLSAWSALAATARSTRPLPACSSQASICPSAIFPPEPPTTTPTASAFVRRASGGADAAGGDSATGWAASTGAISPIRPPGAFTRTSYSTPQSLKNTLGHLAYILEGIRDLPGPFGPITQWVETESSVLEDDFIFCAITNSTSVGGILKLDKELVSSTTACLEVMLIRSPEWPSS